MPDNGGSDGQQHGIGATNTRPKICFIGCGGTLAMSPSDADGTRRPDKQIEHVQRILSAIPMLNTIANIRAIDFNNIDSTNMRPSDWGKLAIQVQELQSDVDAFVITHGTDTLAYTASALALAFGPSLQKPIVLTGSQNPLWELGSDGRFNVENALRTAIAARDQHIREVMICFGHGVFLGCRAQKRSEVDLDAFHSPAYPQLARIRSKIEFREGMDRKKLTSTEFRPHFREGILHIRLTPGLSADFVRVQSSNRAVKGVILESYGAGNVPCDELDPRHNFISVIEELVSNHVPVVIASSFVGGRTRMGMYEGGLKALRAGAIPASDMTAEMAAVKLMWLLGHCPFANSSPESLKFIRQGMITPVVEEVTPDETV